MRPTQFPIAKILILVAALHGGAAGFTVAPALANHIAAATNPDTICHCAHCHGGKACCCHAKTSCPAVKS